MKRLLCAALAVAVLSVGLAGCGAAAPGDLAAAPAASSAPAPSRDAKAGMVMPIGGSTAVEGQPTSTQALVCSREIQDDVKEVLKLDSLRVTSSSFGAGLFTCTFQLPQGPMRLTVQHSATAADALVFLDTRRATLGAAHVAQGLTDHAYLTGTGIVLLVKDNETLEVDTTALPTVFGAEQQRRSDLAYEIASDVLGCWTGDDS